MLRTVAGGVARLFGAIGLDRAIFYTVSGRAWAILSGPITLLFIARYLTVEEQGFYYTFGSIVALRVFFELGVSNVVLQFASHEKAHLEWTAERSLEGSADAHARLSALLRKATHWYTGVAVLILVSLIAAGFLFFGREATSDGWQAPYVTVVVLASINICMNPAFAVLEGCGLVREVAFVRLTQGVVGTVLCCASLLAGMKLFSAAAMALGAVVAGAVWLFRRRIVLRDLWSVRADRDLLSWRNEVWPFQWRIAVSIVSGYFIFHLFNPVLFAFRGAAEAGRMGMSMSVVMAIFTAAISWLSTKRPHFGTLIARGDFDTLDRVFYRALWQSVLVMVLGSAGAWTAIFFLREIGHPWANRVLDPWSLAFLMLAMITNQIVFAEAMYLRAHKKEPFLTISVVSALLVGASTFFLGRQYGALGITAGFFVLTAVVSLGGGTYVFVNRRRAWHGAFAAGESRA